MLVAGGVAALTLALALNMIAAGERGIEMPRFGQTIKMAAFFGFFTLPVAVALALPVGWLWRRFGPLRAWTCVAVGALCGVLGGYGLLRLVFVPTIHGLVALWFAIGGAAAGLALAATLGRRKTDAARPT